MAQQQYLTAPLKTDRMPPGVPYIVGNEAAERFSYYGMQGILVIFMTQYLRNAQGMLDLMSEREADGWYHTFVFWLYILPIFGAFLADAVLGKFWTIFSLSIVYCFGHLTLALDDTRTGLMIGLGLIALGAGGIKPCVSANVGDQFGPSNQHLLQRVFSWFYFSINLGSAFATILMPWLLADKRFGPRWAFGVPGIAMVIATIVFWLGRRKFVHIPPVGIGPYLKQFTNAETLKIVVNLLIPVPFVAMFWALWQQNFSSWVQQSIKMDRHMFGHEWLPAQIQTVNPVFVLLMLPLFSYVIYPTLGRFFKITPLRKIGMGLFMVIFAFLIVGWIQRHIDAGETPHIIWQILAFVVLTAGEVLVSVPHLEFAYTQAPKRMKSLVMCTYLGAVALGNYFTARINFAIDSGWIKLSGANYFFFFAAVMFGTAILYLIVSPFYRGKTYIQDEGEAAAA
jgi:POT family proton-dependent oligopeptide transporter